MRVHVRVQLFEVVLRLHWISVMVVGMHASYVYVHVFRVCMRVNECTSICLFK